MADTQPLSPTDAELTAIYKAANGEDTGKAQPLTTQHIFRAMRAAIAKWGAQPVALELPAPWGHCVSDRIFVGRLPEHARKLAEAESLRIQPLYTEQQVRELVAAPQPVVREPLTDEQSHALLNRMANEADQWADGLSYEPTPEQISGWCVSFIQREIQADHGIKGGQHGVDTK